MSPVRAPASNENKASHSHGVVRHQEPLMEPTRICTTLAIYRAAEPADMMAAGSTARYMEVVGANRWPTMVILVYCPAAPVMTNI